MRWHGFIKVGEQEYIAKSPNSDQFIGCDFGTVQPESTKCVNIDIYR